MSNITRLHYTGIGSRTAPSSVQQQAFKVAEKLAERFILRSGKAEGMDSAFQLGCMSANGLKEIYKPDLLFGNNRIEETKDDILLSVEQYEKYSAIAKKIHPAWNKCSEWAKCAHARNICQVSGFNNEFSKFVIYWAPEDKKGKVKGGTATAVAYARKNNIPTINMLFDDWEYRLATVLTFCDLL